MKLKDIFYDTILPGDQDLNLPAASRLEIDDYMASVGATEMLARYLDLLDTLAHEKFNHGFVDLSAEDRLACVTFSKRKDIRLSTAIIVNCLKSYYTCESVLNILPTGSVPPFPEGNVVEGDDWSILEDVYERGTIYRHIPE